ncbi:MAG TPA: TlpA disulfide reductase family protein [Planctomycetota bacterium]|nr:TlpA disulfide reductase family protein [Planctomycetota bacterium]
MCRASRGLVALLGALLVPLSISATQEETPEAEFRRIEAAYWGEQSAASKRVAEAKDETERVAREADYGEVLHRHLVEFQAFATRNPDSPQTLPALLLVAGLGWYGPEGDRKAAVAAVDQILAKYLSDERAASVALRLDRTDGALAPTECAARLRMMVGGPAPPAVRAAATLSLVRVLTENVPAASPAIGEAKAHLHSFLARTPDSPRAAEARAWLFELERLQVGMEAPDFSAKDQEGKPFRLRDYRGRVVVLDFWAFWCGACMAELPALQAIAADLKNRPFALIGVNGDKEVDVAARMKDQGLAFRTAVEGSSKGPLASEWNVHRWPTTYVIDAAGVLRHRDLQDEELRRAVEALVALAER